MAVLAERLAAGALVQARGNHEQAAAALVALLRANKVPLLALAAALPAPLATTDAWRQALALDEECHRQQRQEYLAVRDAWAAAGIPCLAFKSAGTYPSFPYTSDNLDLLVPADCCALARSALEEMGYIWLRSIDEPRKFLFRKFVGGRSVLAVHVHAWVGWDVEFLGQSVWQRCRPAPDDPAVTVPGAEDSVLVNVAHALYENKRFTLYDLHKISAHWADPGLDWEYMETLAWQRGWHDGLLLGLLLCAHAETYLLDRTTAPERLLRRWERGLERYPWALAYWQRARRRAAGDMPYRVSFAVSKLLYYRKVLADRQLPPSRRLVDLGKVLAWGLKQKSGLRPQRGLLVSLSGPDGAGKSTAAAALASALATSEVRTRVVWTRCGCSPLYRRVARLLRSRAAGGDAADGRAGWRPAPGNGLTRALWAWANAIDIYVSLAWRAWLPRLLGAAVVCDRYAYDAAVELASRLEERGRLALLAPRLLVALSPRPDYRFLLDADGRTLRARADEKVPPAVLASQRRMYLVLAAAQGLQVVDTSQPGTAASDQVTVTVLRGYQDRFRTVLNSLLLSNPRQLNPDDPQAWTPARR